MPEVSIIIPVYNKQKYISQLLHQIMKQSYHDFECILVDDGSTDNSGIICDNFAQKDKRFKIIHLPNCGVSNARNMGLSCAVGKYITFIDADDMIAPVYVENLYSCIIKSNSDLVISGVVKFWADTEKEQALIPPYTGKRKLKDLLDTFVAIQQDTGIYGICVAKIFSKDLLGEIRFDTSLYLAEDFDFYLKIYSKTDTIYFDNKTFYYYLQEADNSSVMLKDSQIDYLAQVKIQLRLKKFLNGENQYFGSNRALVERNINNYFYYTLHYSERDEFYKHFDSLNEIYRSDDVRLSGKGIQQKILLWLFEHNKKYLAKFLVDFYHCIRGIIRKG
ncbi:MAG: glycosyltransferase family 2 protein [Oliverpabstia sp.]